MFQEYLKKHLTESEVFTVAPHFPSFPDIKTIRYQPRNKCILNLNSQVYFSLVYTYFSMLYLVYFYLFYRKCFEFSINGGMNLHSVFSDLMTR